MECRRGTRRTWKPQGSKEDRNGQRRRRAPPRGGGTVVAQQYPSPKGRLPDVPKDGTRDAGKRSQAQMGGRGRGVLDEEQVTDDRNQQRPPVEPGAPPGTPLGEGTHSNISSRCSSAKVVVVEVGEGDEPRQVECRRNGHPRTHTQEPTHSVAKVGRKKKHGQNR